MTAPTVMVRFGEGTEAHYLGPWSDKLPHVFYGNKAYGSHFASVDEAKAAFALIAHNWPDMGDRLHFDFTPGAPDAPAQHDDGTQRIVRARVPGSRAPERRRVA